MQQAPAAGSAPAAAAGAAAGAARASGWRLTPCALDGSLPLPRGDKRVVVTLDAHAPTVLGRCPATRITDAAVSSSHVSVELLAPPRGSDVATAAPLKSAVWVLSGERAATALLSPGRSGAEQPRAVRVGERAPLRKGDMLLLARDPWRHAYRLEGGGAEKAAPEVKKRPPPQAAPSPARAAAAAETQREAETPRPKRQRKGSAPKRRPRGGATTVDE